MKGKICKDLSELNKKNDISIVITGDSLSYNRYDFDPVFRANAYDCYPGMPSWSFMLRDAIYQSDGGYVFGDELIYKSCDYCKGNSPKNKEVSVYSCVNHGKTATIKMSASGSASIFYGHSKKDINKAVLYLQKRPDDFCCIFDIFIDGYPAVKDVSTKGSTEYFQGWELFGVQIPLQADGELHEIAFKNIRGLQNDECRINIAGIGTKNTRVYLTGCGNKTVDFFIDNFYERIFQYNPDLIVLIIGANDRARVGILEFESNLKLLANRIKRQNSKCELLLIAPPSSEEDGPEEKDTSVYIKDKSTLPYTECMYGIAEENNFMFLDLIQVFRGMNAKDWRLDNVHFKKYGNTIVAKNILDILLPEGIYVHDLVDAEVWF